MKNGMRWLKVFFLASFLTTGLSGKGWANGRYGSNYPVQATPFDAKLASVGFFNRPKTATEVRTDQPQSVQNLFLVARSFRYSPHAADDRWQTPKETSAKGSGNCADKAVWLYTQMKRDGYDNVRLVIGKYNSTDPLFHVWVTYADTAGDIYLLDPTLQRQPWGEGAFPEGVYKALYSFGDGNRYRG